MRTTGALLFAAAAALACATGGGGPTSSTNRDACERYAEHLNTLAPCVGLIYDPDNWCEGADQLPVDMTSYYDCLRTNATCEGTAAKIASDQCTPPLVQLLPKPPPP